MNLMWVVYALLSASFAALTAIFAKVGVQHMDSNLATAIRTGIILIITWSIVFFTGSYKSIPGLAGRELLFLLLSGTATGLSWLFYFKAIQLGDISKVAPVDKLSIVFVIILAAIFLQEAVTFKTWIGALLITAGTLVLVF